MRSKVQDFGAQESKLGAQSLRSFRFKVSGFGNRGLKFTYN